MGDYRPEHVFVLSQSVNSYKHYYSQIEACEKTIDTLLQAFNETNRPLGKSQAQEAEDDCSPLKFELWKAFGVNLARIPSLGVDTVRTLFGEIGPDLTKFRSGSAFASWLALCPSNDISGGKVLKSKSKPMFSRARNALRQAAQSLHKSNTYLGDFYRRLRAKIGAPKAITATAHKLARIIYHLVMTGEEYDENVLIKQDKSSTKRQEDILRRKAKKLGFELVPAL